MRTLTVTMYQPWGETDEGKLAWMESKRIVMSPPCEVIVSINKEHVHVKADEIDK